MCLNALFLQFQGSAEDGTSLHLRDFRIRIAQAATAVAQHRVMFAKRFHTLLDILQAYAHGIRHFLLPLQIVGNEFVQRRVEQTHGYRATFHSLEDALEVCLLVWQNLRQRLATSFRVFRQNHFAHRLDFLTFEEHVFRTAQTDAHCPEVTCHLCIVRRIGIGAYLQFRIFIGQLHQFGKITGQLGGLRFHFSFVNLAGTTVQRDEVAFFQHNAVHLYRACLVVDVQRSRTGYAALTHAASHNGSVRSHTATCGQDAFGNGHTRQIFRRSFDTHHYHALAGSVPFGSIIGKEHNLAAGRARRSRQTAGKNLRLLQGRLVEYGVKQFVQLVGFATQQRRLFVNHTLVEQIHGYLHHGGSGTLAVTCLEEPELAFLHGELHVLHILIVVFQLRLQSIQLLVDFGHRLFHGRILGGTLLFAYAGKFRPASGADNGNLLRGTDTCHNVLALCVNQIFAVKEVFARGGIAAEADSRGGSVAHIAEHHCLHAYGSTPLIGNSFHFAVEDGALVHP